MRLVRTIAFALAATAMGATATAEPAAPKSMTAEFGWIVGTWTCHNSQAGKPDWDSVKKFEWIYGQKTLKETSTQSDSSGQFFTTVDPNTNSFKGIGLASGGGYIVWSYEGMVNDKATEVGYLIAGDKLIPVSRSDTERLSDTHFIIRDFRADTPTGKGAALDTEDCTKNAN